MERRKFLETLTAASLGVALGGKLARTEKAAQASASPTALTVKSSPSYPT
jgi:hypothetical protein